MMVTANGKSRAVDEGETIARLLERLGLPADRVVIEHNGEPLERGSFSLTRLQAGDRIEIAQMVGGG
jgi:thiamine biosynthesis protein ThiS